MMRVTCNTVSVLILLMLKPLLITSVKRLKPSKKILGRLKLGRSRWVHLRFLPARWGRERPSASPELSVMLRVGWMIWLPVHPKRAMRPKRRRVIGI